MGTEQSTLIELHTMVHDCHGEVMSLMLLASACSSLDLDGDNLFYLLKPIEEQLHHIQQRLELPEGAETRA